MTWLVPELAGWVAGPSELRTAADAWSRLLPAIVLVGLLPPRAAGAVSKKLGAIALVGGILTAGSRLLLVDPFLDVGCWRMCDPNPLLVAQVAGLGRALEAAGALVIASCAATAGIRWLAACWGRPTPAVPAALATSALVLGVTGGAVLRLAVGEHATTPAYRICFLLAHLGAIGLAVLAARDGIASWRLARRLTQLAGSLESSPSPDSLTEVLRLAAPDPHLQVLYWAPERGAYVDAEGRPMDPPASGVGHRVTMVARRGSPVALLVHSAGIDGERLDRALGAALRLALENDQLRAAALAELAELRRSRARILERSGLERRRLERNLHDGAQQRAVSLALLVRMLASRANSAETSALARRAAALTRAMVADLRMVARGIYPAVLADSGLAGAVLDLAESSEDLAISVDGFRADRYTRTVESTAYLVVAAAIADARGRRASSVAVCADVRGDTLVIELRDDAPPGAVPSLADLEDQVGALSGRVVVEPQPWGTRVRLELPCGS